MGEQKLRLLLVDDQALFAESLRTFLNNYADDMTVAGIAVNGREAVSMAEKLHPDIILMDIRMDGVAAAREIKPKHPDIKIIMLSTYSEDAPIRSAFLAGASGYLLKDISPAELVMSLRALNGGVVQLSPEIARRLVQERYSTKGRRPLINEAAAPRAETKPLQWLEDLTNREGEIFTLITAGYDNDQIADKLHIARQTVRNQISIIYSKLGVKNRFEIIRQIPR
jgi:DNA-binding NarL/FixJ family response regulator